MRTPTHAREVACAPRALDLISIPALLALLVGLLLGAREAGATRLVFESFLPGQAISSSYGDRATGYVDGAYKYGDDGGFTPNVTTSYNTGLVYQGAFFGDMVAVGYGTDASGILEVRLTADPGYDVELLGFDLAGYLFTSYAVDAIEVRNESDLVLWSAASTLVRGGNGTPGSTSSGQHSTYGLADFGGASLKSAVLAIRVDAHSMGSDSWKIAIDNVSFGQAVAAPEPGTALLLGLGVGALALGRRRRR